MANCAAESIAHQSISLNIQTPSQEFVSKKAKWKIKHFGKGKNYKKVQESNQTQNQISDQQSLPADWKQYTKLHTEHIQAFQAQKG